MPINLSMYGAGDNEILCLLLFLINSLTNSVDWRLPSESLHRRSGLPVTFTTSLKALMISAGCYVFIGIAQTQREKRQWHKNHHDNHRSLLPF